MRLLMHTFDGKYNEEKIAVWNEKLGSVFNRGFWDGYYLASDLGNGAVTMVLWPQKENLCRESDQLFFETWGG